MRQNLVQRQGHGPGIMFAVIIGEYSRCQLPQFTERNFHRPGCELVENFFNRDGNCAPGRAGTGDLGAQFQGQPGNDRLQGQINFLLLESPRLWPATSERAAERKRGRELVSPAGAKQDGWSRVVAAATGCSGCWLIDIVIGCPPVHCRQSDATDPGATRQISISRHSCLTRDFNS